MGLPSGARLVESEGSLTCGRSGDVDLLRSSKGPGGSELDSEGKSVADSRSVIFGAVSLEHTRLTSGPA